MREIFLNSEVDRIYVSVVHYNSLTAHNAEIVTKSLNSILAQEDFVLGKNLFVRLCDNGSKDRTGDLLQELVTGKDIYLQRNQENLGFSAAHNQSVFKFLNSNCNYLLIVNPDLAMAPTALKELVAGLRKYPQAGIAGCKLYRGDDQLEPVTPRVLDSAGMVLTNNLRHFDRGSDEQDRGQFDQTEFVFGITGACMLIKKAAVQKLLLPVNDYQQSLYQLYPQLEAGVAERYELFDESFFAYREDADLCWRANNLKILSLYLPLAEGIHRRVVLPTNRQQLDPELNYLGVRNRFLLQINNYNIWKNPKNFFPGLIFRNLLVFFASLTVERTSRKAFRDLQIIFRRAWKNRQILLQKISNE